MLLVNHLVFSEASKAKELSSSRAFWSYFRSYCLSYASGSIVFAESVNVHIRLESDLSLDKNASGNSSLLGSISLLPMMNRAVSLESFIRSSALMQECPIWLKPEMSLLDKQGDICMHYVAEFNCLIDVLSKNSEARQALIRWIDPKEFEAMISQLYPDLTAFVTVSRLENTTKSGELIAQWDKYLKIAAEHYLLNCRVQRSPAIALCDSDFSER